MIEDSRNGVLAAKAAGMHVVATTNHYTEKEGLSRRRYHRHLPGRSGGERGVITKGDLPGYDGVLHVAQLVKYFEK